MRLKDHSRATALTYFVSILRHEVSILRRKTAVCAGYLMSGLESTHSRTRFGVFELDLETGELRKSGVLLRLPPQPFKVLALLASRPAQLVTREELREQICGQRHFC